MIKQYFKPFNQQEANICSLCKMSEATATYMRKPVCYQCWRALRKQRSRKIRATREQSQ